MRTRRTLGAAFVLAAVAVPLLAAVGVVTSGLGGDLARCDEAADSLDVMACGLTLLSTGGVVIGVGGAAVVLLAIGSWLLLAAPGRGGGGDG